MKKLAMHRVSRTNFVKETSGRLVPQRKIVE